MSTSWSKPIWIDGRCMDSTSEMVIRTTLQFYDLRYGYNHLLSGRNGLRKPDFTFHGPDGLVIAWEHNGMMNDSGYLKRWREVRVPWYLAESDWVYLIVTQSPLDLRVIAEAAQHIQDLLADGGVLLREKLAEQHAQVQARLSGG